MPDLRTNYLGMELANPLVPSASPLSGNVDTARRLEDAGAAALVMYSLFQETVEAEDESVADMLHHQDIGHPEASTFRPVPADYRSGLDAYLEQVSALRQTLAIPVIASLNGNTLGGWLEHAREVELAGAAAIELNLYHLAADPDEDAVTVEERYLEVIRELRRQVGIPLTVKLTAQLTAPAHFIRRLEAAGADGAVLFNRFYQPDLDLENLRVDTVPHLSRSEDVLLPVRWIALLRERVGLSLAATGGVHTAEDALKALFAGADVAHLCSALLANGPEYLSRILTGLQEWLAQQEYDSVAQLKGSLSHGRSPDPDGFERSGYIQVISQGLSTFDLDTS